jgi:glycosyltransferase involved in cell wall biosynthesis
MTVMPPTWIVSVIIPAYNAEAYLGEALESVLGQTWSAVEAIVVDDGSTDGTLAIAEAAAAGDGRVRVVSQRNAGPSAARNAGMAVARGEAVCFLDADDVFLPDKVSRQMQHLLDHADCALVYSDFEVGDEELHPIEHRSVRPIDVPMRLAMAYRTPFAPLSVLLRRSLVEATGGFDPSLAACEDRDYWIRAERLGQFCYLTGPVGIYRTHSGQSHRDLSRERAGQRATLAKNFAPGSPELRIARSCLAYSDARIAWGRRRLLVVAAGLLRSAWYARTPAEFGRVRRWAGYG